MLNRSAAVYISSASSGCVSRSNSSVASPPSFKTRATNVLRGLWRLLPLPCANTTMPLAFSGILSVPSSLTPPVSMRISRCRMSARFIAHLKSRDPVHHFRQRRRAKAQARCRALARLDREPFVRALRICQQIHARWRLDHVRHALIVLPQLDDHAVRARAGPLERNAPERQGLTPALCARLQAGQPRLVLVRELIEEVVPLGRRDLARAHLTLQSGTSPAAHP